MTQCIPETFSMLDWSLALIMGNSPGKCCARCGIGPSRCLGLVPISPVLETNSGWSVPGAGEVRTLLNGCASHQFCD